ncbi:hypothetical protein BCR33DRAFT_796237 [Rhizoclosmatium globosum]|uniref:Uncharacterized protein n=1 Tax=Rhizoclosmatium globosum TaxID=329046 RepID=A0A1Y2AMV2_9FUNG|nr:hypothetical protein BCR33DRAFT_796237 [Rhizoclosmatium globosum]|eukprot:ORY23881.1 hypothetical protein BCR33DRAFT_796237 [Rhizoclosmatium globosum]
MAQAIHQVLVQYNHWANEKLFGHLSSDLVKEKVTARYQELIRESLVELDGLTVAFLSFLGISSGTTNLTESTSIESVCAVILNSSGALLAHLAPTDTSSCQPITSESILSFTNKSTQIRGTISGFLCMCGLKPLALDALYIKPCKEVTDPLSRLAGSFRRYLPGSAPHPSLVAANFTRTVKNSSDGPGRRHYKPMRTRALYLHQHLKEKN